MFLINYLSSEVVRIRSGSWADLDLNPGLFLCKCALITSCVPGTVLGMEDSSTKQKVSVPRELTVPTASSNSCYLTAVARPLCNWMGKMGAETTPNLKVIVRIKLSNINKSHGILHFKNCCFSCPYEHLVSSCQLLPSATVFNWTFLV